MVNGALLVLPDIIENCNIDEMINLSQITSQLWQIGASFMIVVSFQQPPFGGKSRISDMQCAICGCYDEKKMADTLAWISSHSDAPTGPAQPSRGRVRFVQIASAERRLHFSATVTRNEWFCWRWETSQLCAINSWGLSWQHHKRFQGACFSTLRETPFPSQNITSTQNFTVLLSSVWHILWSTEEHEGSWARACSWGEAVSVLFSSALGVLDGFFLDFHCKCQQWSRIIWQLFMSRKLLSETLIRWNWKRAQGCVNSLCSRATRLDRQLLLLDVGGGGFVVREQPCLKTSKPFWNSHLEFYWEVSGTGGSFGKLDKTLFCSREKRKRRYTSEGIFQQ